MRWVRPQKLPLLIAWMVIAGVIYYLGTHPHLMAPYVSNLVSRHLLRIEEGGLRVRDFRVRTFEGLDLYGVSLTLPAKSGGLTLISADTVTVDFGFREVLGTVPHFRRVEVARPEIYSMAGTDTTSADPSGNPELNLPELMIDHLVIREAFLEFSDSGGRLVERIPRLDLQAELRTGRETRAVLRGVDIDWETHASTLNELRGNVVVDAEGIRGDEFSGRFNGHHVAGRGGRFWNGDIDVAVIAEGISIPELENLLDQSIGFNAAGDVDGTLTKRGDEVQFIGVFSGELEGYLAEGLSCIATVTPTQVVLEDIAGTINGATLAGEGLFDITDSEAVSFVLEGDVRDVDLAKGLIPGEEDLPATDGFGRLRIEHTDRPEWTRVTGVLHGGFIEIIPFDTCYVDVSVVDGDVHFTQVELLSGKLHGMLEGVADTAGYFEGNVSLNSEDLGTVPAQWNWPGLKGRLNGQGTVKGPVEDLEFAGWMNVYDFGLGPVRARSAELAVMVNDLLGHQMVTTNVEGHGFSLRGAAFGDFSMWGSADPEGARIDSFRTVRGDTTVFLSVEADYSDSLTSIQATDFQVDLEGTRWSIDDPVTFTVGKGHFYLPEMRLASDQGAMSMSGLYEADEVVAGSLRLESFDLALLNPFTRLERDLAGRMTADVVVGGEPSSPQVNLTADLLDAPFALADIHSMHVAAAFSEGTIDFKQLDLHSNFGRLKGEGTVSNPGAGLRDFWAGADLDLDLNMTDGDWAFLDQFALPALDRLAGTFNGEMKLGGSVAKPVIRGKVQSAPFNIHWLHLDALSSDVYVDSKSMVLGNLVGHQDALNLTGRIELPLELDLMSEPVSPPDGAFFMQLEIPQGSNLGPLSRATNAFVTSSGTGGAKVIISGPLAHPLYQGTVSIRDAGFVLRNMQEVYHECSADGVLRGDELTLTDIKGNEGLRGTFSGEGKVRFEGLVLKGFEMTLDLDRFLVASIPDLAVVVSGNQAQLTSVQVGTGNTLVPKFSGNLEIMKARYTGSFKEGSGGNDPLQATVTPDWLADLELHGAPRVATIVNRELEIYLGGDLDLVRNEEGLYLRGSLDVNSGRLIVFNNNFEVRRGRLDFSRELGFDPRLDIDAETKYRLRSQHSSNSIIEVIGVHVTGPMSAPDIRFSSDRGYSREAIQRMLLGLEPHATPEGDSARLASTSISAGLNMVEREIAQELDIFDTIEIDQIQRDRAAGDSTFDPLIGVGKYIGSDLYLKYAQGIRQDDRDVIVEYQINQHLLLQSEVRRRIDENQGTTTYNLDFKYRFEY